jgi:predicted ArsR family transcriptional regulator
VNQTIQTGTPVENALRSLATERGRRLGDQARQRAGKQPSRRSLLNSALAELEEQGYEPRTDAGEVVLVNCPFHALVGEQREPMCGMNLDLLSGMADAVGDNVLNARLEPSDDCCCVRLDTGRRARKER